MNNSSYVMFLVLGTALVALDGQIIYRSGLRYLANSYGDRTSARSMARLVSVLFHLAVLGVLALISTIHISADTALEGVVLRLGVVFLTLAIAHGITVGALTRIRGRLEAENITKHRLERADRLDTAVHPAHAPEEASYTLADPMSYEITNEAP